MTIRLIDAGTVSPLRSQTIYHGIAHARNEETPDTVILATPAEPYVSIGFHQDIRRELDLEFCQQLPVIRREVGGGAVVLDRNQLFVQWVFHQHRLPARIDRRFELFTRPLVETYRALGVDAAFHPVNDVRAGERKISGTGAARIGDAEVVVGNFLVDFDTDLMTRILNVPSETFRRTLQQSLEQYMTSIRRETGTMPDQAHIRDLYVTQCQAALARELVPGELTDDELRTIDALDARFASTDFIHEPGGLQRAGVKIHEDVWVREAVHAGTTVTARLRGNRLDDVTVSGASPELHAALRNVELRPESIEEAVRRGGGSPDQVQAILELGGSGNVRRS